MMRIKDRALFKNDRQHALIMLACETEFDTEDKNHAGYSLCEYDIYAWVSLKKQEELGIRNHRLSVWKNLKTGEYELYRNYCESKNEYEADIIFKSTDMMEVLDRSIQEWDSWHGTKKSHREPFVRCDHKNADRPITCRIKNKKNDLSL